MLPFEDFLPFEKNSPFEEELPFEKGKTSSKQPDRLQRFANDLTSSEDADAELEEKMKKYKEKPSSVVGDLADLTLIPGVLEQIPAGIQAGVGVLSGLSNFAIEGGEKGSFERGKHWFSQTGASKALTPRTTAGQAIAGGVGALIGGIQEHYQDPENAAKILRAVPLFGEDLSKSHEAKAALQAAGDSMFELLALEGGRATAAPLVGKRAWRSSEPTKPTQSLPKPTQAIEPTPVARSLPFEEPGAKVFDKIVESQISGEQSPMRKYADPMEQMRQQLDAQKQSDVQAILDQRQKQMELEVAQRGTLDFNAAERARQEAAPTGAIEAAVTKAQEATNQRLAEESQLKQQRDAAEQAVVQAKTAAERVEAVKKANEAQEALNLRQTALEQEVAQRTALDFGAAERRRMGITQGERGAINLKAFEEGFEKVKELANGIKLRAFSEGDGALHVSAFDKDGKFIGRLSTSSENWANPKATDNLKADWSESYKPGTAKEMYTFLSELGNDIVPSKSQTAAGKHMWQKFEQQGVSKGMKIPRSEQGVLNFKDISDSLSNAMEKLGSVPLARFAGKDALDHASEIPGMGKALDNLIIRPDAPEAVLPKILAEKDGPALIKGIQSGLQLTGEKVGSTAMKYTAQNLLWAAKKTERIFNSTIKPLQKAMDNLGVQKQILAEVLKTEMMEKALYTPEQLREMGLKDKAIAAYTELRKQFDTIWEKQNEANVRMGREPITKLDAYLASIRNGSFVVNIVDKEGKLAYSSRMTSMWQARKAVDWFKKNLDGEKFDLNKLDWTTDKTGDMREVPRDVLGAYQRLGELIDPNGPGHLAVKAAIDEAMDKGAYNLYKQSDRFLAKKNIRGFEGDMPWLSAKENANRLLQSQIDYLRDGYHWTYMQDALANITPLLENQDLMKSQPNNMAMIKTVVAQQTGLTRSLLADAEKAVAESLGFSRGTLSSGTRSLKSFTYLQQLGFSTGYMIATPFQALNGVGLALRERGLGALSPTVIPKTFLDGFSAIANDIAAEGGLPNTKTPMTKLGQTAFEYAEANGIITKNLFDQQHTIGENRVGKTIKNVGGFTISLPEKVQRTMTFMAFVHHLDEMGVYKDNNSLFRRAEELTDMASTNFHSSERPTMVGNWGSLGELAYTYHAPIFNYYNQMSMFARDAVNNKQPIPFVGMLAMTAMLGGALALPGINEVDGGWNLIKTWIADAKPDMYDKVSGLGVKGFLATHLPEAVAYGAISEMTGSQMSTRFTPNIVDVEQPLSGVAPVGQEIKEWSSIGNAALNPTARNAWQAAYANSPPLMQGLMQTHVDAFKGGKNAAGQVYLNPRDLGNPMGQITRTPEQEAKRAWGLRDLSEAKERDLQYINNKEQKRVDTAYDGILDKAVMSLQDGNKEEARRLLAKASKLLPDSNKLQSEVTKKIVGLNTSAEQRELMRANSIDVIQKIQRIRNASK